MTGDIIIQLLFALGEFLADRENWSDQWLAYTGAAGAYVLRFAKWAWCIRRDRPSRIICAKRGVIPQLDNMMHSNWDSEKWAKELYVAAHNGN